jgi:hypothetical protein
VQRTSPARPSLTIGLAISDSFVLLADEVIE